MIGQYIFDLWIQLLFFFIVLKNLVTFFKDVFSNFTLCNSFLLAKYFQGFLHLFHHSHLSNHYYQLLYKHKISKYIWALLISVRIIVLFIQCLCLEFANLDLSLASLFYSNLQNLVHSQYVRTFPCDGKQV